MIEKMDYAEFVISVQGIVQEIGQLEVVYKKVRSKRNVYGKKQMDGQVSNDLSVFCIDN